MLRRAPWPRPPPLQDPLSPYVSIFLCHPCFLIGQTWTERYGENGLRLTKRIPLCHKGSEPFHWAFWLSFPPMRMQQLTAEKSPYFYLLSLCFTRFILNLSLSNHYLPRRLPNGWSIKSNHHQ